MSKLTEITIHPRWSSLPPFTVRVGDQVLAVYQAHWSIYGPATVQIKTVAKLCGGSTRQWVRLSDGQEFNTDGESRTRENTTLRPMDTAYLTKAVGERALFENLQKLKLRLDRVKWQDVLAIPGAAEKLKDLLDAIEAKV